MSLKAASGTIATVDLRVWMAMGMLSVAVDRNLTDAVAMLGTFASATGLVSTT